MDSHALKERSKELNLLTKALDNAPSNGNVILVSGETGSGKTRLIEEFERRNENVTEFVWGRCDPFSDSVPFSSIFDISHIFSVELRKKLSECAPNHELFHHILDELINISKPKVLVFEDMHWADKLTIDFLLFLGRRLSVLKVVMIVSFREDELKKTHPLYSLIAGLPTGLLTRIKMKPLSPKAVASILKLDSESTQEVYQLTNGNPLFVTELAATWSDHDNYQIPSSIVDLVKARMTILDAETTGIIETLSTVPQGISVKWFSPNQVGNRNWNKQHLSSILETGLVVQKDEFNLIFKHELLRIAIESQLSIVERIKAEETILEILEDSPNTLASQLVHHASGANLPDKTIHYALQVSAGMEQKGAHLEAAKYLKLALRFVADAQPEVAAELYERWAFNESLTNRISDEVISAHRQAITLWKAVGHTDRVVRNLQYLTRLHRYRGEISESSRILDQAINLCKESDQFTVELGIAYGLRAQLSMLRDQLDDAIKWGFKSIEIAKQYNDIDTLVHSLNTLGTAKVFSGQIDGEKELIESLNLAIKNKYHEHASRAYNNLAEYAIESRQYEFAEHWFREGIAFNLKYSLDLKSRYFLGRQAFLKMEQGDYASAKLIAKGILENIEISDYSRLPALVALTKTMIRMEGNNANTETLYNEAKQLAYKIDEPQNIIAILLSGLEAAWLSENYKLYPLLFEELLKLPLLNYNPWQHSELIMWSHRLNFQIKSDSNRSLCKPVQLELSGDIDNAADEWIKIGAPFHAACVLTIGSQKTKSRLLRASELFSNLDSAAGLNRVHDLAEHGKFGFEPSTKSRGKSLATLRHPLGLTKRELQILELIVTGLSNQDIAQKLQRSIRTIENHVSSILAKLNTENRVEAIIRVQSEPWLLSSSNDLRVNA